MERSWFARDSYDVAFIDRTWYVLVRGGDYYLNEPYYRVVARLPDKDEAFRVRNALRATLPAPENT